MIGRDIRSAGRQARPARGRAGTAKRRSGRPDVVGVQLADVLPELRVLDLYGRLRARFARPTARRHGDAWQGVLRLVSRPRSRSQQRELAPCVRRQTVEESGHGWASAR
jgi:hypothetical protein